MNRFLSPAPIIVSFGLSLGLVQDRSPVGKMRRVLLSLIKIYQKSFLFRSPILKALFLSDAVCRFRPTCSEYTYQAISRYGIILGSLKGLERIVKCHPWSKGGHDPLK